MGTILIVDDDSSIRESLSMILQYENYNVQTASQGKEALSILENDTTFDVILMDIKMPGMDGLELLEKVKELQPEVEVIMISGLAEIQNAVEATKKGAYDFLEKPLDENRILLTVKKALHNRKLTRQYEALRLAVADRYQLLGSSPAIQQILETIKRAAPSDARVLISGENGTGKELVARAIHAQSPRADHPFIDVNCAAIPGELIESELFGHEKGAFTSACIRRAGKFEQAEGGTLFLDEIGDMSLAAQSKVLRVLEENKIERVGGTTSIPINVRIIAATNKNLEKESEDNRFRQDLFYRLNVIPLHLQPLRERCEDIPLLVSHFFVHFSQKNSSPLKKITEEAMAKLQSLSWPGNVRELKNLIERLVILCPSETIGLDEVKNYLPISPQKSEDILMNCKTFEDFKIASEKLFLQHKLVANNWNVKKTAEDLDMQRSNLYKKIERYGLTKAES